MQPYLFPYIGYFQLVKSVDTFVFYDDVAYVKGGWINRNYIKDKTLFTIPIKNKSSNININKTYIDWNSFRLDKFLKTLKFSYESSIYSEEILSLVREVFTNKPETIAALSSESVIATSNYLNLKTKFKYSSSMDYEKEDMVKTLINICNYESGDIYINSIGGKDLYNKEVFSKNKINLQFISTDNINYNQGGNSFTPNLSIIDVLMNCSRDEIKEMLGRYKLI